MTPGDNPFAKDNAKRRKRALGIVGAVILVAVAIFAIRWLRSPDRVMDENRAFIEGLRAKYCKVLDNEKKTEPNARTKLGGVDHATMLGVHWFDGFDIEEKGGNLDEIQIDELEAVCSGGPTKGGENVHSTFGALVDTRPSRRDGYTRDGLRKGIAALGRAEYVLVVRVDQMTASTAVGESGLARGRFKARAALWRLSDGAFVQGVNVDGETSSIEYVEKGHEDLQLKVKSDEALERAIANRFTMEGIPMKLDHDWSQP